MPLARRRCAGSGRVPGNSAGCGQRRWSADSADADLIQQRLEVATLGSELVETPGRAKELALGFGEQALVGRVALAVAHPVIAEQASRLQPCLAEAALDARGLAIDRREGRGDGGADLVDAGRVGGEIPVGRAEPRGRPGPEKGENGQVKSSGTPRRFRSKDRAEWRGPVGSAEVQAGQNLLECLGKWRMRVGLARLPVGHQDRADQN